MKRTLAILTLMGGLALATVARADTFDFNLSGAGGGFSGSGTLTASEIGSTNIFSISDITGTGVTGLINPFQFGLNDNLLYLSGQNLLDPLGFSFTDDNSQGMFDVNIFEISDHFFAFLRDEDGYKEIIPITFSLSPSAVTPEPSSLLLVATGLFGMLFAVRKRILGMPA
jgi:hypothetical protein